MGMSGMSTRVTQTVWVSVGTQGPPILYNSFVEIQFQLGITSLLCKVRDEQYDNEKNKTTCDRIPLTICFWMIL